MKRASLTALALLLLFPVYASAQKRQRTVQKKTTKAASAQKTSSLETMRAAELVAEEIKRLSRFLYLYGGISKGIETADAAERRGEATRASSQQTARSKAAVLESIANMKTNMDALELEFYTKPGLQRFHETIEGIGAEAANAERLAAGGQYDQAGRTLLDVLNKLTDVLVAMR